jgi:hypothetical protein
MKHLRAMPAPFWLLLASVLLALLFVGRISLITARFPLDVNEGWNAAHAMWAFGAGPLYPPPGGLIGNNYPPLSFAIVGGFGLLLGDPIVAGRIIALVALFVVAGGVFAAVRRFSPDNVVPAAIGALLFLGFNATLFRPYVAMNDPQWLGHAFMLPGFLCLIPRSVHGAPDRMRVVAAALLIVIGGLVKQNLVALPLAATIWLAQYHRRALRPWLGTAAIAGLGAVLLCYQLFGLDIFSDLFGADRQYSWLRMLVKGGPVLLALTPMVLLSARLWNVRRSDNRLDLLLIAALIALVMGVIQRSGQGVDKNAHFESLIMLSITTGVAFALFGYGRGRLILLLLPFVVILPKALAADVEDIKARTRNEHVWAALESRIASVPGAVACEHPAACFMAGKPYDIDFFLYGEHVLVRHDDHALQQAIAEHRFAAVQLEPIGSSAAGKRKAEQLSSIFELYYRTIFVNADGRRLLIPRDTAMESLR